MNSRGVRPDGPEPHGRKSTDAGSASASVRASVSRMLAENTLQRLGPSELLADVASGGASVNGGRAVNGRSQKAAA